MHTAILIVESYSCDEKLLYNSVPWQQHLIQLIQSILQALYQALHTLRCGQFSQCRAFCKEQNCDILNVTFLERSILPYLKDPSIPNRSEWVFFPPGLFSSSVLYNSALNEIMSSWELIHS